MRFLKRVNLKIYLINLFAINLASLLFVQSVKEAFGIFFIFFATMCNHFFLIEGTDLTIVNPNKLKPKQILIRVIPYFFAKFMILIWGFYIGVHFMGARVIIPIILYVMSIFILFFCIRKEQNK